MTPDVTVWIASETGSRWHLVRREADVPGAALRHYVWACAPDRDPRPGWARIACAAGVLPAGVPLCERCLAAWRRRAGGAP